MRLFANRRLRIEKNIITKIHRNLPGNGQITVYANQEVAPQDILGVSEVPSGYRTINIAQKLEVSAHDVKKYLQRQVGQSIFKGELLAFKPAGILQGEKIVVAPNDSLVDLIDDKTGTVRLNFLHKKNELPAGVFGVVEKVDPRTGKITIRTEVTKIYGVVGTGKLRDGILRNIGTRADLINAQKVTSAFSDSIIIGGGLIYKEAIYNAISLGVNGIITGGINAKDFISIAGGKLHETEMLGTDVGVSILVVEGFGSVPIGLDIYQLLQENIGKYTILDGNRCELVLPSYDPNCMIKVRSTRLPDLSEENTVKAGQEIVAIDLNVGNIVRVIGSAYTGEQGVVKFIDKTPTLLPSGIKTFLLTIETRSKKIKVPYSNVEVIG